MGSWGHGIHHCKAFNTNFWYFVQYLALTPTTGGIMEIAYNNIMMEIRKYHFKLFLTPKNYFLKYPLSQRQRRELKWIWGNLFNILSLWINTIGIFWYHPQGQLQAQVKRVLENGGLRPQFKQFQKGKDRTRFNFWSFSCFQCFFIVSNSNVKSGIQTVLENNMNFIIVLIWFNTLECPGVDRWSSSSMR